MFDVVVVIATSMQRTHLLKKRSLRSVYQQQGIQPLCVYIVDDNEDEHEIGNIRQSVSDLRQEMFGDKAKDQNLFHTKVMRNRRTKQQSGSGAWNTAAMHAYQVYGKKRRVYLALLDDDDAWYKNYLQQCVACVLQSKEFVAAVVSSFVRISGYKKERTVVLQKNLNKQAFYIGNPGWQGSNTFVSIRAFWMAGGFDESMPSTHDRDFAIRLLKVCEHKGYQVASLETPLWEHYAHEERRVTTSKLKHKGLTLFYNKYLNEMSAVERKQSFSRAKELFQYKYPSKKPFSLLEKSVSLDTFSNDITKHILIGVTSSSVDNVFHQLQSILKQLDLEPRFSGRCSYIVMGNGTTDKEKIKQLLLEHHDSRLEVKYVCLKQQRDMLNSFPFHSFYEKEDLNQKSIAFSRSLLQFRLWKEAQKYDDCVVLILDDDLLFESLMFDGEKGFKVYLHFFAKLMLLSECNADVIISKYTDAPPLPFYSSLRVQLLDIQYHLQGDKEKNVVLSNEFCVQDDYYYDLSTSNYQYLEKPLNIKVLQSSAYECIKQLGKQANTHRPLFFSAEDWNRKLLGSSFYRGGIAIFINLDVLIKLPHLAPEVEIQGEKKRSRRSDFISSILLMESHDVNIQEACFPLRHKRSLQKPCVLGMTKMAIDIFGASFYRALLKSFQDSVKSKQVRAYFNECIQEFVLKLEVTELRAIQLIYEVETYIQASTLDNKQELLHILSEVKKTYVKDIASEQMRIIRRELQKFDVIGVIDEMKRLLC